MIKLEPMRVLVAVVDARGLSGAAARLGRTPGALSMTLRELEDRLGGRLFETDRKTRMTPLGAFVLDQARRSVEAHDRAVRDIMRFAHGTAGSLRIAAVPSIASRLLPAVFADLKGRAPMLRLELRDIDSQAVGAAVLSGKADLGLASAPADGQDLAVEPLFDDLFVALCRRDSALADQRRPVTWDDLRQTPFIANGLCDTLALPAAQALVAQATLTIRNVWSLLAFVEAGHGTTLLPAFAAPATGALIGLPLQPPAPSRTLSILRRKDETDTPSAALFLDALRRETARFSPNAC